MQTITVGSNTYNLAAMPARSGAELALAMNDAVAVVASPYVPSQVQTQSWPGADGWEATLSLPPLSDDDAAEWEGFLAELRGMQNVFQMGDPRRRHPRGSMVGSAPAAATGNTAMLTTLHISGLKASAPRVLLRGDLFQLGYHLYRICAPVSADASGLATVSIWPSLREAPAPGTALGMNVPKGLWRLADNRRETHYSVQRKTTLSIRLIEAR